MDVSGNSQSIALRDNILWALAGYDVNVASDSQQGFQSDYNDLFTSGVVTVFGKDIRELFAASTGSLAGEQGANNAKKAKVTDKTMKTFSEKE